MDLFGLHVLSFAFGATLAATASWFYYTHAMASKVNTAIADVKATVSGVQADVSSVKATVAGIATTAKTIV